MALYLVRRPNRTAHLNGVIVDAADASAALIAAQSESAQVKDTWAATLLTSIVTAATPLRSYRHHGIVLSSEKRPGQ